MSIETIYFDVTVSGAFIDPLKFYEYEATYNPATPVPTQLQSRDKAEAFTRFQEIKKALTAAVSPVYYNLEDSGTGGTAAVVPTSVSFILGFTNTDALYEFFEGSKDLNPDPVTPADKLAAVITGLSALGQDIIDNGIDNIGMEVLDVPSRNPGAPGGAGDSGQLDFEFRNVPSATGETVTVTQRTAALPNPF